MPAEERVPIIATVGLALVAMGAFLPWARIGGRGRSGFHTADTFIALADGVLPDAIAWVGRWWYLPAFLTLLGWATAFLRGRIGMRVLGIVCMVIAAAMWWLFVWAGQNYNVLDVQIVGPAVASLGLATIAFACSQRRDSLLKPNP